MALRDQIPAAWPALMPEAMAAAYCGCSRTHFRAKLVPALGLDPARDKVAGKWVRDALDEAIARARRGRHNGRPPVDLPAEDPFLADLEAFRAR